VKIFSGSNRPLWNDGNRAVKMTSGVVPWLPLFEQAVQTNLLMFRHRKLKRFGRKLPRILHLCALPLPHPRCFS
jgi:hypothetical protein